MSENLECMKCTACGLVNFSEALTCGRCGHGLGHSPGKSYQRNAAIGVSKPSSSLYKLLFAGAIAAAAFYLFGGESPKGPTVSSNDTNHISVQSKEQPHAGLSRTEQDQQRTVPFRDAVRESPELKASQARTAETEKLMQPASDQ